MRLSSILNRRSASTLVLDKNARVAVNGGGRRREGRRWQHQPLITEVSSHWWERVGHSKRALKSPLAMPFLRHDTLNV